MSQLGLGEGVGGQHLVQASEACLSSQGGGQGGIVTRRSWWLPGSHSSLRSGKTRTPPAAATVHQPLPCHPALWEPYPRPPPQGLPPHRLENWVGQLVSP